MKATKFFGILFHLLTFTGLCTFCAGWIIDLGYFNNQDSGGTHAVSHGASLLGNDALASITDPMDDAFVVYLFITLGLFANIVKMLHTCCSQQKYVGLVAIIAMGASNAVGGFVAGPKGKSFLNCLTNTTTTNTTSVDTSCIKGENETPILLMFLGSSVYIFAATFIIGIMYVSAMSKAFGTNRVEPVKVSEMWV